MNVGKRQDARFLAYYGAFKALENQRFSASYTVSNFIGNKILATYIYEEGKK